MVEIPKSRCSAYNEAIITQIESGEQQYCRTCACVICKKIVCIGSFFIVTLYNLQEVEFSIRFDRCEVEVGYGLLNGS